MSGVNPHPPPLPCKGRGVPECAQHANAQRPRNCFPPLPLRKGEDGDAGLEMSDAQVPPTAIVDPAAEIGSGTSVRPYCVIGPEVVLGPNCWLQHHVTLCVPMKAGAKNKFYAYCSIGQQTQDLKYRGEPT